MKMVHSFRTEIAAKVGLNAAVIYHNIEFWTAKKVADKEQADDGLFYIYNSITAWCELFPYLTRSQIRTALDKLLESGLVVRRNDLNKRGYDQTMHYALSLEALESIICEKSHAHLLEIARSFAKNRTTIPVCKPVCKPDVYQNEFGTREQKKSAHEKKPKKPKQFQYPQEFEDLWALRPRRDGGNPKRQAFNAYKARLREGHTHDEMLQGMLRYAKHQEAAGNIDTPYVQQLATFFGPSLAFTESWDIKPKKKPQSRSDRFREEAETIRKMSEWADEQIKNQGSTDWRLLK